MAAAQPHRTPLRAMYLQTHDVARQLKPSKDGVVAHALHETLHFALDGEVEDWGIQQKSNRSGCVDPQTSSPAASGTPPVPQSESSSGASAPNGTAGAEQEAGDARVGFFPSDNPQRPFISYAWDARNRVLSLPSPAVAENPTKLDPCSPENRNAFDVTAKFFYLTPLGKPFRPSNGDTEPKDNGVGESAYPVEWIEDAMKRLTISTGLITLDTLVLAFPTLQLNRDKEEENGLLGRKDALPSIESSLKHVRDVWSGVSQNPQIGSLGLSDVSLPTLQSFLQGLQPPPPPAPETSSKTTSPSLAYGDPSANRRPRIVQMNLSENPCRFDKDFRTWTDKEGITVVAHNDQKDVLPSHTLPGLFSEFTEDLPHPLPDDSTLQARWVLKYSVLIEARGVIADQGYIVYAEAVPKDEAQDGHR